MWIPCIALLTSKYIKILALRLIPEEGRMLVHDKTVVEGTLYHKSEKNSRQYKLMNLNDRTDMLIKFGNPKYGRPKDTFYEQL